jgi:small subunit ribosomal protein S6
MTRSTLTYDLVVLADAHVDDDARAKVLADTRALIEARGEIVRDDDWGDRTLAFPIEHRTDAHYHLLQFHAATPELLSELNRTLQISDEIVRFRIIKLKPGTPDPPEMRPSGASSRQAEPASPAPADAPAPAAAPTSAADAPSGGDAPASPGETSAGSGEAPAGAAPADAGQSEVPAGEPA